MSFPRDNVGGLHVGGA